MKTEQNNPPSITLSALAWVVMLLASMLPRIFLQEVLHQSPGWLDWAQIIGLVALALVAAVWSRLRLLRNYLLILAFVPLAFILGDQLTAQPFWKSWFPPNSPSFVSQMMGIQLSRLLVTLLMIAFLLLLGYLRKDFFLTLGNLKAPIKPVKVLGFPKPDPWTNFGGQWAVYISLGSLAFLYFSARPSADTFSHLLTVFPAILLFAVLNAFSEEVTFRAALIAGSEHVVGARQAVWLAALYFGIAHFYGVPYGILGVVMASFLGWMMGKAMVETRGLFWAWLIHFLQDVLIFSFMAMGAVTPGG